MNKAIKYTFAIIAVIVLALGAFTGGFVAARLTPAAAPQFTHPSISIPPTTLPEQQAATPQDVQNLFAPFWETWNLIHKNYVDQPVDDVALMRGAINGMMDTLTTGRNYYLDPKQMEENDAQLNGKDYEGIGAYVDVTAEYLTVISPIKGSPAEKAGLRPGDQIIAIDGEDMTGMPPEEVRQKVLGPRGTKIILTILRKDTPPFDVTIIRDKIVIALVEYRMLKDSNIGYIQLNTFGDTADAELKAAIKELLAQNPKGLILDLRNNGGGYLEQGIAVASEFLPKGKMVVYEKYGDGRLEENLSRGNGAAENIPLAALVNEGSASASEIVAGALQDYGRAKLVGTQTYGKGSVQNFIPLSNNQGAVGITAALWLTPNKRLIDKIGLTPDVVVNFTEADYNAGRDPQLEAAVETLLAQLTGKPLPTSMPTATP